MGMAHGKNVDFNLDGKFLLLGLNAAGKTTLVNVLAGRGDAAPRTTRGFYVEPIQSEDNLTYCMWDVSGKQQNRRMWRHYLQKCDGVIFVVDSSDITRLSSDQANGDDDDSAEAALHTLLSYDELGQNTPILVLAHKQDVQGAFDGPQVARAIGLSAMLATHPNMHLRATSIFDHEGLEHCLRWLRQTYWQRRLSDQPVEDEGHEEEDEDEDDMQEQEQEVQWDGQWAIDVARAFGTKLSPEVGFTMSQERRKRAREQEFLAQLELSDPLSSLCSASVTTLSPSLTHSSSEHSVSSSLVSSPTPTTAFASSPPSPPPTPPIPPILTLMATASVAGNPSSPQQPPREPAHDNRYPSRDSVDDLAHATKRRHDNHMADAGHDTQRQACPSTKQHDGHHMLVHERPNDIDHDRTTAADEHRVQRAVEVIEQRIEEVQPMMGPKAGEIQAMTERSLTTNTNMDSDCTRKEDNDNDSGSASESPGAVPMSSVHSQTPPRRPANQRKYVEAMLAKPPPELPRPRHSDQSIDKTTIASASDNVTVVSDANASPTITSVNTLCANDNSGSESSAALACVTREGNGTQAEGGFGGSGGRDGRGSIVIVAPLCVDANYLDAELIPACRPRARAVYEMQADGFGPWGPLVTGHPRHASIGNSTDVRHDAVRTSSRSNPATAVTPPSTTTHPPQIPSRPPHLTDRVASRSQEDGHALPSITPPSPPSSITSSPLSLLSLYRLPASPLGHATQQTLGSTNTPATYPAEMGAIGNPTGDSCETPQQSSFPISSNEAIQSSHEAIPSSTRSGLSIPRQPTSHKQPASVAYPLTDPSSDTCDEQSSTPSGLASVPLLRQPSNRQFRPPVPTRPLPHVVASCLAAGGQRTTRAKEGARLTNDKLQNATTAMKPSHRTRDSGLDSASETETGGRVHTCWAADCHKEVLSQGALCTFHNSSHQRMVASVWSRLAVTDNALKREK